MKDKTDMMLQAFIFYILGIITIFFIHLELYNSISTCEAKLPRDQNCALIAVPKEIRNETN